MKSKVIGHRVVQGGAYFDQSVIIDEDVVSKIDELKSLAPLPQSCSFNWILCF
mgnify:CR=1 FL=1